MTKQVIEIGTPPSGNDGDTNRDASIKINANFTELYTAISQIVRGPAQAVGGEVAVFSGTTGKDIVGGGILGSAAFQASTAFATAAQGTKADGAERPLVAGANIQIDRTNPAAPVIAVSGPINAATAAEAVKLQTPRMINGVAFDGTQDITVADGTKEPAVVAGTGAQYWDGNKTWVDFATSVRGAVITGVSFTVATAINATDTVLIALGKLQKQLTDLAAVAAGKVSKAGDTMSGALNLAPIATIASSATPAIGASASNTINITGTTGITGFDAGVNGAERVLVFAGALTLTNSATLILPKGQNITTAAGDVLGFTALGSGVWRCTYKQVAADGANATWGAIAGTLSAQTDLQAALDSKRAKRVRTGELTLALNTRLDIAHGMSPRPSNATFFLICKTVEAGFAVGDTLQYQMRCLNSNNDELGSFIFFDDTNVYVRQPLIYSVKNKSTGAGTIPTLANWRGYVEYGYDI